MRGEPKTHKVVMVVYPLQGHITPMLQLATILHSKGLSITLAYPSDLINLPSKISSNDFTCLPLEADEHGTVAEGGLKVDGTAGVIELTAALNEIYKEPFEKSMRKMMECGRVCCVVYDAFMYFAQTVADQCNVPGVNLRTSCAASILGITATHGSPELASHDAPLQVPMEYLVQVPELQTLELDCVGNRLKETSPRMSVFDDVKAQISRAFTKSSAIVLNTMGFLEKAAISEAQKFFKAHIYPIGPFHKLVGNPSKSNSLLREDPSCITWLDQQPPRSVLYVSFGSLACMTEEELLETASGLVQSNQRFLWVVRPGSVRGGREWGEFLPKSVTECVDERGCIVGWAPQRQVLAHGSIGGFWTHCGWNSTIECVCEGVPMICRPFLGDQFWNANYICKVWKIGLNLNGDIERGVVKRVVKELLVDKVGQTVRQRALDLKKRVESCVKEGGSTDTYVDLLVTLITSRD